MHSSSFDTEVSSAGGGDVLVSVATLVTEGRIPAGLTSKSKKFYEGPHCTLVKGVDKGHVCSNTDSLCLKFESDKNTIIDLCQEGIPLCIEVLLTCACKDIDNIAKPLENVYVLEQWHFSINLKRNNEPLFFNLNQLVSAIRSQLYFSQITAWLTTQDENSSFRITEDNFHYHLTVPGKTLATTKFHLSANKHEFPLTEISSNLTLNVSFFSLPRTSTVPDLLCSGCLSKSDKMYTGSENRERKKNGLVDDRMHTKCTLKGKHRCEDFEEYDNGHKIDQLIKRLCQSKKSTSTNSQCEASTSTVPRARYRAVEKKSKAAKTDFCDLMDVQDKAQLLLDAIERSGKSTNGLRESDNLICDTSESDIISIKEMNKFNVYVDEHCDSPSLQQSKLKKMRDISNIELMVKMRMEKRAEKKFNSIRKKITFEEEVKKDKNVEANGLKPKDGCDVPSPSEQAKFRKSLDSAASMVFHSRTGLPLTSSPAPVRRGKSCFDFDSSINSVSAIKSALFSSSFSTDDESESEGSIMSPCSPENYVALKRDVSPVKYRRKGHAANLLGSFEESVLNGRLEPVSTVHGFRAELGASGSFVPKHLICPVTVFFYTLGDNDKVSSPYLGHINLGKKGYNVPKSGTVQVTLFNPLGTVVKMFVIMYNLLDMPPNSQTFIRQRTLYMPTKCKDDDNLEWGPKWLRYLIHLRFMSSKSGKIYLHSDIRMIIFRKCDMDTATAHGIDMSYELRSFTHSPANPRFSPRK